MLSEINQAENDKHRMASLVCESQKKKVKPIETVEKWWPGTGSLGKEGEVGKRVQIFSYVNRIRVSNVEHGDYSWQHCTV